MPFTINQKHQIPRNKSNKRYSQDLCPEIYITFLRDIEVAKTWKQKKVHKQMNGQRRSGIWTHWNISHEKNKRMA